MFSLQKNASVKTFFLSVLGVPRVRISDGTAATCGMHTERTHALQVIQEALHSLCAQCRDAHAHPTKCIPG